MVWRKAFDPMGGIKYGCKIRSHQRVWKWPYTCSVTNHIHISCTIANQKLFSNHILFSLLNPSKESEAVFNFEFQTLPTYYITTAEKVWTYSHGNMQV